MARSKKKVEVEEEDEEVLAMDFDESDFDESDYFDFPDEEVEVEEKDLPEHRFDALMFVDRAKARAEEAQRRLGK